MTKMTILHRSVIELSVAKTFGMCALRGDSMLAWRDTTAILQDSCLVVEQDGCC